MILDTNAVSALADGDPALRTILIRAMQHHLVPIVSGEYRYGLKRSRERVAREQWLLELESCCAQLSITVETAQHYALIREELRLAGHPIPENDIWIAALAREFDLEIISRDSHFDFVSGLKRVSW